MQVKQTCLYLFLCCLTLSFFSACDNDKDDFEGVSKLISSRNAARYKKAEQKKARKIIKPLSQEVQAEDKESTENQDKKEPPKKKKFSTEIYYEEEIQIISSSSKNTLGIGTAYLNKDGKIVQIKIKRN